jgi:hypothetical protein
MLSWPVRRGEDSRVYRCIKKMKRELQWANLVKRATILALAQGVRVSPSAAGMADAFDRPLDCSRETLFDLFRIVEAIRDQSSVALDTTQSSLQPAEMFAEHRNMATRGVEVWMCTLGAGIVPDSHEDVVLIWSYLASSFSNIEQAIRNLRYIEKRMYEATGTSDTMLPSMPDEEWKKLCAYVPSALRPRTLGLARLQGVAPTMDREARSPGRKP